MESNPLYRVRRNILWSFAEQIPSLAIGLISVSVLAKYLNIEDVGLLGVATSFLIFAYYFDVGLSSIFLRDELKIKQRNIRLSAFIIYSSLRVLTFSLVGLLLGLFGNNLNSEKILAVSVLFLFSVGLSGMLMPANEFLFSQYRQKLLTIIKSISRLLNVILLCSLIFFPNLFLYISITIISTLFELIAVYTFLLKSDFSFSGTFSSWGKEIWSTFSSFGQWSHYVGISLFTIYWMDLYILQFFESLKIIGDYTLSLKIANYFYLFPSMLEKNLIVLFSRESNLIRRTKLVHYFAKLNFTLCLVLTLCTFTGLYIFLKYILGLDGDRVSHLMGFIVPLCLGTFIRNLSRTYEALIITPKIWKPFLISVIIPTILISLTLMIMASVLFGAIGVAWSNVVIYTFFYFSTTSFVLKRQMINNSNLLMNKNDIRQTFSYIRNRF